MSDPVDCAIVGAGPAGLMAALHLAQAGLPIRLLEQAAPGGQALLIDWVANFPGRVSNPTGAELIRDMLEQVRREGVAVQPLAVRSVRKESDEFLLDGADPQTGQVTQLRSRLIIACSGARPRRLEVPGEEEFVGKGVFHGAFLPSSRVHSAVVIGGGDVAFRVALSLASRAAQVHLIFRGDSPRALYALREKVQALRSVESHSHTAVQAVLGDDRVTGVLLKTEGMAEEHALQADMVSICVGKVANIEPFSPPALVNSCGGLRADLFGRTSVPGLFAAGDVRGHPYRQMVIACGDGMRVAMVCERVLRGELAWSTLSPQFEDG